MKGYVRLALALVLGLAVWLVVGAIAAQVTI
jgi:hypothetical protein